MSAKVSIESVSKSYQSLAGGVTPALKSVSLTIEKGEFLTIVGSSGSGKSTLLQLIAGIEVPTTGTIMFEGDGPKPRIGIVFQSNTIFPWRTVEDNLTYALEVRGIAKEKRRGVAAELCRKIGLIPETFLRKYPKELSGGETRRVAIGMALAYEANILLMDEPTSQLDYWTKLHMQELVQSIWMEQAFTAVYVTHDIDEAIFLGDRVMVFEKGEIRYVSTIELPRPRDKAILASSKFCSYRDDILSHTDIAYGAPIC